ncbi:MAG: C_GCAxxG_C_C family protein [Oscillospiraceae bacterium]|jgi:C_GCAxxG_C_C family probable redox protein|nr:C_GCAxxG_C_C family protein [Oscillospiraceae bacterium]
MIHQAERTCIELDHGELARSLFLEGYNCAQSVFCAFADVTGMDREQAARFSASFGGGMGRLREVCGAMSAALMVLGLVRGYSDPTDMQGKKELYVLVQEYSRRFQAENGSYICRELLSGVPVTSGSEPEERNEAYYLRRPCPGIIEKAARVLDQMLAETASDVSP